MRQTALIVLLAYVWIVMCQAQEAPQIGPDRIVLHIAHSRAAD